MFVCRFTLTLILLFCFLGSIIYPTVHADTVFIEENNQIKNYDLTRKESYNLFQIFLIIEKKYDGMEKIRQQIKVLYDYNLLPQGFSFSNLEVFSQKIKNNFVFNAGFNNRVFAGPMIVSHFVPFGGIHGTSFDRYWFYEAFSKEINMSSFNTSLDGVIGALPVYVGFSFKPVFVTAVGYNVPRNYQGLFFPFFEILLPCFGFSLRVISDNVNLLSSSVLFEYNLDLCFVGFLKG